ncbi:PfkB family carbohydrate kinase [Pseudomonadota bacterium]
MSNILAVGIATLDIINSVNSYPNEDDEVRAASQRICRGGNATNTLAVLSQLGHNAHWAGVLANEPDMRHIEQDLQRYSINTQAVERMPNGKVPTSYITHNLETGSRTIVHHRDLPEYSFAAFKEIDLKQFDWIHFEGRNVSETAKMLEWYRQKNLNLPCSVEIEKEREGIEQLFKYADILLFSRPFAEGRGHNNAMSLLKAIQPAAPNACLICTWGESGAWALDIDGQQYHSPSFPPAQVVDTLAAGDTFNAGMIDACAKAVSLEAALTSACQLAGRKCGHEGLAFI